MEEKLKMGFKLIMSGEYGNISGGYLKETESLIVPIGLTENEKLFIANYPFICEMIKLANILELMEADNQIVSVIGKRSFDESKETQYFEEFEKTSDMNLTSSLEKLNARLESSPYYTDDSKEDCKLFLKYQFYANRFLKKR